MGSNQYKNISFPLLKEVKLPSDVTIKEQGQVINMMEQSIFMLITSK